MTMSPREIVQKTVRFENPERVAHSHPQSEYHDLLISGMTPSVDKRPGEKGTVVDEWGAAWENIGICKLGEVKEYPLKDWKDFDKLTIPDPDADFRWKQASEFVENNHDSDKFMLTIGVSLYERIHFIRGLENTWTDIYLEPDNLRKLIDLLVEMNLKTIERIKNYDFYHGYMFCDDWGLQNKLMISPDAWHEFWQPAYRRVYQAARDAGLITFLHSCGYIVDILDGLIDAGLDVIQMDQQLNMGLDLLSERFRGRITFWCPVDIQNTMCRGSLDDIRNYCRDMFRKLATPSGGFIAGYYADPVGAGHSPEAVKAMLDEFMKLDYTEI